MGNLDLLALAADFLIVLGLTVMTLGVVGIFRMPDVYTRLHGASKSVFLGVISLGTATFVTRDSDIISRVILIAILLIITTPVSAHAIARATYRLREPMVTPGAIDESGHGLESGGSPNGRS